MKVLSHQNFVWFLFLPILPRVKTNVVKLISNICCIDVYYINWLMTGTSCRLFTSGEDSCFSSVFSPSAAQRRPGSLCLVLASAALFMCFVAEPSLFTDHYFGRSEYLVSPFSDRNQSSICIA